MIRHSWLPLVAICVTACEVARAPGPAADGICDAPYSRAALPPEIEETSGLAASRAYPGIFWTHNDSGNEAFLYAVDSTGTVRGRVAVRGATNRDWEDLALAPCDTGDCLYISETGDNNERYPHVAVFRVPEPEPGDTATEPAERFRFRYPDGPRDAESLFVTDAGIHVIGKGRSHAIELFRLPPEFSTGSIPELEHVQRIAPPPTTVSAQVTAAASVGDSLVVVRTYASLQFFWIVADTLEPFGPPADLTLNGEPQGEGVDFLPDGRLVLSSESQGRFPATISLVRCDPRRADTAADTVRPGDAPEE